MNSKLLIALSAAISLLLGLCFTGSAGTIFMVLAGVGVGLTCLTSTCKQHAAGHKLGPCRRKIY